MEHFIFGTLSTLEKRVARTLKKRNGLQHNNALLPQMPRPNEEPTVTVTVKHPTTLAKITASITEPHKQTVEFALVQTEWDLLDWKYVQIWEAVFPALPDGTLVRYSMEGMTENGEVVSATSTSSGQTEKNHFAYLVGNPSPPNWSKSAIIYQIFPDRFASDEGQLADHTDPNDIYGGTLRGIIDRLDYIADLGFNCIWLNPFFPDSTHHGYHASDYFSVNPRLGTMDDVRELIEKAHAKDIRLLLDFVCNHWGDQHATFQDAVRNRDSEFYDWYNWTNWPEEYETFFGVQELPQVNVDNAAACDYLLDSAEFWLKLGFDGLRLDYAVGPSHAFWAALRQRVKAIKPDAWMFGEVVEDPGSQVSYIGRLDGCIDFLLAQNLRATFAIGSQSLSQFDHFLTQHEAFFSSDYSRPSFFDNHDMDRLSLLADGDLRKVKLAALCQFTLSGAPVLYYGTEVNVKQRTKMHCGDGFGMAEARRPMLWDDAQDKELLAYFQWLIQFRAKHPVFWEGQRMTVHVDDETQTYAYEISTTLTNSARSESAETILVAFNLGPQTQTINTTNHTITLEPLSGTII